MLSASLSAHAQTSARTPDPVPGPNHHDDPRHHTHLGMWVTADGHIRHELLPNGRYDEQRGQQKHAYQGRYWVKGNRIVYLDDTGFTADGEFRGARFHHGGYVFFRESVPSAGGK
ncbi:MAG: Atu4866 domain-containing protein [Hydrogenophaga sp.]|nr:Atu4866 domain-containing protein [Hydrogenophaga sp.]